MRIGLTASSTSEDLAWCMETLAYVIGALGHEVVRTQEEPVDLWIDVGGSGRPSDKKRYGRRVVFLPGCLSFEELDAVVYMDGPYHPREWSDVSEIWCWDLLNPAESLDALSVLFDPVPIRRVPLICPPSAGAAVGAAGAAPTSMHGPWSVHIVEENRTNSSTAVLCLVAVRELVNRQALDPGTMFHVHHMSSIKDNRFLKENVLDNLQIGQLPVIFDDTTPAPADSPSHPVILSHIRFIPLRESQLGWLLSGYPMIHNSPLLRDQCPSLAGTYYEGNQIVPGMLDAVRTLQNRGWDSIRVREELGAAFGFSGDRRETWALALSTPTVPSVPLSGPSVPSMYGVGPSPLGPVYGQGPSPLGPSGPSDSLVTLGFLDMWPGFDPNENFFMDALRHFHPDRTWTGFLLSSTAAIAVDMIFVGPYGSEWKTCTNPAPMVFFTAEHWELPADPDHRIRLWLTSTKEQRPSGSSKVVRIPTWMTFIDWFSGSTTVPSDPVALERNPIRFPLHFATHSPVAEGWAHRPEFCAFVVSNPTCAVRNAAYHALNAYRPVGSGGHLYNNIGGPLALKYPGGGAGDVSKHEFFRRHRFTLSFENASVSGYLTEKLLHAKMAGCVPLYWGDPAAALDVVPGSFVNLSALADPAASVVDVVKHLEHHPDRCERIAATPLLDDAAVTRALALQRDLCQHLLELLPSNPSMPLNASDKRLSPVKTFVINLDTRPDRWTSLLAAEPVLATAERVPGVLGKTLEMTPFLRHLFAHNQFQWKKSVMGCNLSHMKVWARIADAAADGWYVVLEDDVRFVPEGHAQIPFALAQAPADAEVLYFGGVLPPNKAALPLVSVPVNAWWDRVTPNRLFTGTDGPEVPLFHFCAYSYAMTPAGARKILAYLASPDTLRSYTVSDHLLGSPHIGLVKYHLHSLVTYCFQEEDPAYLASDFNALHRKDVFDSDIWNNTECFEEPASLSLEQRDSQDDAVQDWVVYHLGPVPDCYEKTWLQDMFQCTLVFRAYANEADGSDGSDGADRADRAEARWYLLQRPYVDEWTAIFRDLDRRGIPFKILHLSDEFLADDLSCYTLPRCRAVIRNYFRDDCPTGDHLQTIPLGYHYRRLSSAPSKTFDQRELVWSFHGTDWFQRGRQLQPLTEFVPHHCHLQPSWNHPTATGEQDYLRILGNSRFCPILRGNNKETFRLYEALEAGTLPLALITDVTYLYHVEKELGIEKVYAWNRPHEVLRTLSTAEINEKTRQEVQARWEAWKDRVRAVCAAAVLRR